METGVEETPNEEVALVPIEDLLPELRAEEYEDVREWDAARLVLEGQYEAADGEYLLKIRDVLKAAGHGLWTGYLRARGIPTATADVRIRKALGKPPYPSQLLPHRSLPESSQNEEDEETPPQRTLSLVPIDDMSPPEEEEEEEEEDTGKVTATKLFKAVSAGATEEEVANEFGLDKANVNVQVSRQAAKRYWEEHPPLRNRTTDGRAADWWGVFSRFAQYAALLREREENLTAMLETAEYGQMVTIRDAALRAQDQLVALVRRLDEVMATTVVEADVTTASEGE